MKLPFLFKRLTVPQTNETVQIESVQTWEVRWKSRHGVFSHDTRPECEIFTQEETAREFKTALENAFKLVRNTCENRVTIEKSKSV